MSNYAYTCEGIVKSGPRVGTVCGRKVNRKDLQYCGYHTSKPDTDGRKTPKFHTPRTANLESSTDFLDRDEIVKVLDTQGAVLIWRCMCGKVKITSKPVRINRKDIFFGLGVPRTLTQAEGSALCLGECGSLICEDCVSNSVNDGKCKICAKETHPPLGGRLTGQRDLVGSTGRTKISEEKHDPPTPEVKQESDKESDKESEEAKNFKAETLKNVSSDNKVNQEKEKKSKSDRQAGRPVGTGDATSERLLGRDTTIKPHSLVREGDRRGTPVGFPDHQTGRPVGMGDSLSVRPVETGVNHVEAAVVVQHKRPSVYNGRRISRRITRKRKR